MSAHHVTRRLALGAGLGGLSAALAPAAKAQGTGAGGQAAYPNRPVTMIVGFPPGGQTDFAARIVQPGLATNLGQSVVIDNRGGAGGNIGTEAVLRARPDGYTLLAGNSSPMAINPHTFPSMTINPLDLVPIGLTLQSSMVLCVHPSVPASNVQELTAWIKAQRDVNYGSPTAGSLSHCAMELFRDRIGKPEMTSVPYRGSGPAIQDFVANRFSAMFDAASVLSPFIKSGQLKPILVSGARRAPALPDVPTAAEQGLQDFVFTAWIGLFAPKGTPDDVVRRVWAAQDAALKDASVREKIITQGDEPGGGTTEEFAAMVRRDHARWGQVVKENNISAA